MTINEKDRKPTIITVDSISTATFYGFWRIGEDLKDKGKHLSNNLGIVLKRIISVMVKTSRYYYHCQICLIALNNNLYSVTLKYCLQLS